MKTEHALGDLTGSIRVNRAAPLWRRFLGFAGPGVLVAVGYMDPGNWGTDLLGGSKYGYALLWVILLSNIIAQFLQVLCAKLGIVTGKDLAVACRDYYTPFTARVLWVLCEVAIIACDLAEVIGSAVALKLLLGIPLIWGVLITGLDVLLLLGFSHFGFRKIEAIVLTLVTTVTVCFLYQVMNAGADWGGVVHGMVVPTIPGPEALMISLGILGATVMPHNLYLHSSIVQTRKIGDDEESKREALRYNRADTILSLSIAFIVNAAILIVAASVFHSRGHVVQELEEGHRLLGSLLGGASATAFAVALLASGQSSTITGTLAGQIVMEGFLNLKIKPWSRRLITRGLAIVPALILVMVSGGTHTVGLLVLSQVVLSMQLPFAIFPLIKFTSDRAIMGSFANSLWVKVVGYVIATVIAGLNVWLIVNTIQSLVRG